MQRCFRSKRKERCLLFTVLLGLLVLQACEKTTRETIYTPGPGCQTYTWQTVWPLLGSNEILSLGGSSESNVFAVGDYGAIAHYNGTGWERMDSKTNASFQDVYVPSSDDAFAVGGYGMLLHYDGASWKPFNANSINYLRAIWGTSADDFWFGGGSDSIFHWDGSTFSSHDLGSYEIEITCIWGTGASNIFAVGRDYSELACVWHYDGMTWSLVTPSGTSNSYFFTVWGWSASNILVAGDNTAIYRWNGSTWDSFNTSGLQSGRYITSLSGRSESDIYAIVSSALHHYDGSTWSQVDLSSLGDAYPKKVWCGATKTFIAGYYGLIAVYDGATWHDQNGGLYKNLCDVWTDGPNEAFALSSDGQIFEYDGSTFTRVAESITAQRLCGISGSRNSVYAVGSGGTMLRFDGTTWTDISNGLIAPDLMAVWAIEGEGFAVGSGGAIVHISGTTLTSMTSGTNRNLNVVWGNSPSDVFVAGDLDLVLHYDGTSWSSMTIPGYSGYGVGLRSICGSGRDDVYACDSWTLFHYDGSSWQMVQNSFLRDIESLWMAGPNSLFVVASPDYSIRTIVYHFDGTHWTYQTPFPCNSGLLDIHGSASDNIFAVGYGGAIIRYEP